MNELLLELTIVVLFACLLLQLLFASVLRNRLKNDPHAFSIYFTKTSFMAIGPPRMDRPFSLKAKYYFPFSGWNSRLNNFERILLLGIQVCFLVEGVALLFGIGLFVGK